MKKEVIKQTSTLLVTAFGLVAALAWNDAIKKLFDEVFGKADSLTPMFIYALVVTIIAVFVTIWIGRISEKKKEESAD